MDELSYLRGFGNALSSEAEPGSLPLHQNSPRQTFGGLYAEQINGTPFTTPRSHNTRVWLYRLRPQITPRRFTPAPPLPGLAGRFDAGLVSPEVLRFRPLPLPETPTDFLDGLRTFGGCGDPTTRRGVAIHTLTANADMQRVFANADADLLLVPEHGRLRIQTELGWLLIEPTEIAIIPRCIRFRVSLPDGAARGFVAEVFDGALRLPDRGPVGANGMADERHFLAPVAAYENRVEETPLWVKQGGDLWHTSLPASPFDVVAWHGSYLPWKYNLRDFNSLGTVSFDHPDPSILTVLTAPTATPGLNALDVGVFLGRWDVAEHTFRPPYFHRNSAVELNAVLKSPSDSGPWQPGAFSYTPCLTPHGVSSRGVAAATGDSPDKPTRLPDTSVWLQLESGYQPRVMPWVFDHPSRDQQYLESFAGYPLGALAPQS